MIEVIASLLSIGLLWWVLWPLLSDQLTARTAAIPPDEEELHALLRKKETIYSNIRDLRFEHDMGKLSDKDFQELETGYQFEAAEVLKRIELLTAGSEFDTLVEREVLKLRDNGKTVKMTPLTCPSCNKSVQPEFQFCTSCGTALSALPCETCGSPLQPGMNFCPTCGRRN